MGKFVAFLAVLGLAMPFAETASAASPAYCALYAREFMKHASARPTDTAQVDPAQKQRAEDQAFYKCLNLDEDPPLPEASAYADTTGDGLAVGGPFEPAAAGVAEGDVSDGDVVTEPPPEKPPVKVASGKRTGSGLTAWTPEWKAWCRKNYPNSFDAKTGMTRPYSGGKAFCR